MKNTRIYIHGMAGPDAKREDFKTYADAIFRVEQIGMVKDLFLLPPRKEGDRKSAIVHLDFFENDKANMIYTLLTEDKKHFFTFTSPTSNAGRIDFSSTRTWTLCKAREKREKKAKKSTAEKELSPLEKKVEEQKAVIDFLTEQKIEFEHRFCLLENQIMCLSDRIVSLENGMKMRDRQRELDILYRWGGKS